MSFETITPGKTHHAIEVLLAEVYGTTTFTWEREKWGDVVTVKVTDDKGQTFGLRGVDPGAERHILSEMLRSAVAKASLRMVVSHNGGFVPLAAYCAEHGWPGFSRSGLRLDGEGGETSPGSGAEDATRGPPLVQRLRDAAGECEHATCFDGPAIAALCREAASRLEGGR